jgi:hypothetical protein
MRFSIILILLILPVTGCNNHRDARLHMQVAGAWKEFGNSGNMTLDSRGSFHARFTSTSSNDTKEWAQDGTWDVKDGFLIFTTTNGPVRNTPFAAPVGRVARCKITFINNRNMVYLSSDGKNGFSWTR